MTCPHCRAGAGFVPPEYNKKMSTLAAPSPSLLAQYELVIGLEVHVQLATRTKIFCSCPVEVGNAPNTNVCPVCLGLPGALPVLSRQAVEQIGRAHV